eukprot:10660913-Lingulodinium_polyedra.AAC.1
MEIDSAPRTPLARARPASQASPSGAGNGSLGICPPTLPDQTASPAATQVTERPTHLGALERTGKGQEHRPPQGTGDEAPGAPCAA